MHEMSITQGIVELSTQHAAGRRIQVITIEIGDLSGVVPEAIEFCFAACTIDSLAAGARLVIERIAGAGTCLECGLHQPVQRLYDSCSGCGSHAMQLLAGQEMRVREIEVED